MTLTTSLLIVAASAAACALVVRIHRSYAAIPPTSGAVCPEEYATPAVLLWIILGSTAFFAWRGSSVTRLAAQVAISSVLVTSRLWLTSAFGATRYAIEHDVVWPLACFGVLIVIPLLLRRFTRAGDWVLLLVDSSAVALLANALAVQPYVPKL